jgi:pimeloyl-ACP methyl ester carboxylesterase
MDKLLLALLLAFIGSVRADPTLSPSRAFAPLPNGNTDLQHGSVIANGVRLHYVVAGKGKPVLLISGWPESWYTWRWVIPQLVHAGRRVYAVDPRGFGGSEKPLTGYDPDNTAKDLHEFIIALGLAGSNLVSNHLVSNSGVDIVTHDVGTWIGYVHAATFPQDIRRLVLTEASLPGISTAASGIPSNAVNIKTWQFAFNRLDDLPETLVQGHERAFISWLYANKSVRGWTLDDAALDQYVREFSSPGAARAGFAYYRSFFDDAGLAAMKSVATHKLAMPILALGGDAGVGAALGKTLQTFADNVHGDVIADCGHFLADECPNELVHAITEFWRVTER